MRLLRAVLVVSFCASPPLYPQSEISSGDIAGTLRDSRGRAIPLKSARLLQPSTGTRREAYPDASGQFRFLKVAPGIYNVELDCDSCPETRLEGIEVRLGETYVLDVEIDLSAAPTSTFVIDVTGKPPVVETSRTQQANNIDAVRIRALPINRRNYLDFALLAPGVLDSTSLTDDTDFRVAQSPQSGISIGGNNGRGNSFSLDGISIDYNSGGVRPSVSQEAVQEFQINRSGYAAEFGGSIGGTVNIVSRSGSNEFHGNLFGFLRHRGLQARNYFDTGKSPYTRVQWGATAGGAIRRNRTHIFAAFEQLDRHETVFVPILDNPGVLTSLPAAQDRLLRFFESSGVPDLQQLAGVLGPALIPGNHPGTLSLFRSNSGNFPFAERATQGSLRVDHRFSNRRNGFLRAAFTDSLTDRTQFGAQVGVNRGRSNEMFDGAGALGHTWVPGRWLVETRAGFAYNKLALIPTDPFGPELNINGFGLFGRDIYLPSVNHERYWQAQQNFARFSRWHVLRFGAAYNPARTAIVTESLFGGQFAFGEVIPFGSFLDLASGTPGLSTGVTGLLTSLGRNDLVRDLASPLSALQAFSLGLPTYYQQGFGQPSWVGWAHRTSYFLQDAWTPMRGLKFDIGLRYELELKTGGIFNEKDNAAPRFGFAWSPRGGIVIRGGYGLFHAPVNAMYPYIAELFTPEKIFTSLVPLTGLPGTRNPATGAPVTSADIFQLLVMKQILGNRAIRADDLSPLGLNIRPGMPLRARFTVDPEFRNPYSQQASLEVERSFAGWSASAAWNFNRALRIAKTLDQNLALTGREPDGRPVFSFRQPEILQYNVYQSTANSYYHAGIFQLHRRMQKGFSLLVHYTWSKAIDDVTDFIADYQPQDQSNARAERALSSFHRSHRLGANGVWQIENGNRFIQGFVISGILEATSGTPFNVLTGYDNIGDNHATNHRPWGAGRNIGRGPNYLSMDLRVGRDLRRGPDGRWRVQCFGEVFNALNRTNFRTINNVVGSRKLDGLPSPLTGIRGPVSQPLSFTSASAPRQFQVGIKVLF